MKNTRTHIGTASAAPAFGITLKSNGNMDTSDTVTLLPIMLNTIHAACRNHSLAQAIITILAMMITTEAVTGIGSQVK